jgi:5-methylcytosine-specific restriction enzyme subunit McrC
VSRRTLTLTGYQPQFYPGDSLTSAEGQLLWEAYSHYIRLEFPNPATQFRWRLQGLGSVGRLMVSPALELEIRPAVEPENLFEMLVCAYRLRSFKFLPGLTEIQRLDLLFERLALVFAERVLSQIRQGLYRTYLTKYDTLPYVRGRLDPTHLPALRGDVRLACRYEAQTADIDDNRLLTWTLYQLGRWQFHTEQGQAERQLIRRAYRYLQQATTLQPFTAQDCVGRQYNRLNESYRFLHSLCRLFLDHLGPGQQAGSQKMIPFMLSMPHLFELFVAEWLRANMPPEWTLRVKENVSGSRGQLHYELDLVLYETHSGRVLCVLDTKYKTPDKPSQADVNQAVAYASLKHCQRAALIYPRPLPQPLREQIGQIAVQSFAFDLRGNLAEAGAALISALRGYVKH